ncbi:MAG: 50S ribosomal protein L19 [Parcubacteria group bacterium CG10_big_fil_rev_8_21_14_0_10_38_31]|nr:MAG: 50S ribosomal protein L19 [Parcubacteria group bacterium CG10_big_fil_rev_8_21_14_0_10_38_31]
MNIIPEETKNRSNLDMGAGDVVRVWVKIEEKGKTRLQAFEGLVIARKHGSEPGATFTVRKTSGGIGVERIFPLFSPSIDRIEVVRRSKVRKSKLYYIRDKAVKEIKKKMKRLIPTRIKKEESQDEEVFEKVDKESSDDKNEINTEVNIDSVKTEEGVKEVEVEVESASK